MCGGAAKEQGWAWIWPAILLSVGSHNWLERDWVSDNSSHVALGTYGRGEMLPGGLFYSFYSLEKNKKTWFVSEGGDLPNPASVQSAQL